MNITITVPDQFVRNMIAKGRLQTIKAVKEGFGPLSLKEAKEIADQMFEEIGYCHHCGGKGYAKPSEEV